MKNLFKKTSSSSGDASNTPTKKRFSESVTPRTPPVTPSPTKESNLSVRVIPSQREPTAPPSSQELVIPEDESSLFTTVLGMGCGSPLWDGTGASLAPIPEENVDIGTEWRKPPSFEDNSVESLNHDDFEVVLQNEDLGRSAILGPPDHSGPHIDTDLPLFCQPCEADMPQDTNTPVASDDKRKKKRFKLPKMKSKKGKSKKSRAGPPVDEPKTPTEQKATEQTPRSSQRKNRKTPKRKTPTSPKSLRKIQIGKLFHARFHKKRSMQGGAQGTADSHSTLGRTQRQNSSTRGRWKCVHDPKRDRVYYYQTHTREVTWDRPPNFIEWRVAHDLNKRQFFYNAITKKTRWEMPDGFEEWAKVMDEKSGKPYYYNVLTKKTTWKKPADLKNKSSQVTGTKSGEKVDSVNASRSGSESKSVTIRESDVQNTEHVVLVSGLQGDFSEVKNPRDDRSPEMATKTPEMSTKETVSPPARSTIPMDEPPKITKSNDQERLAKLLSTYCPNEKENNAQLLKTCRGQEAPIIKGITGLVEDTPFDELRLVIFSYVKTTLREIGGDPFDERNRSTKSRLPPVTQNFPKKMNRVTSTAGYSLGSRALSHVTGRSEFTNLTEQTNRINNTSNRALGVNEAHSDPKDALAALNERWNNMSLNNSNSFDEMTDVTDDEGEQVVLDMKVMQTEDVLRPVSRKLDVLGSEPTRGTKHIVDSYTGATENIDSNVEETALIGNTNTSQDAETLESAYAADNDDETDTRGWEEEAEDDMSALSDSFGPSIPKRYLKEKNSRTTQEEESLQKEKVRL
jgi:hypothetical protein